MIGDHYSSKKLQIIISIEGMAIMIDRIRAWNRSRLIKRIQSSRPRKTVHGFKFRGLDVMITGEFEALETIFLKSVLLLATSFINIGANYGYYRAGA